jgi:hypothetical protein
MDPASDPRVVDVTLLVARCPACGAVAADPAPGRPGPLACPRCWLMFGYDPDAAPPVDPVEIRAGQLWAPRQGPVRVIGFPGAGWCLGVNLATGRWVQMQAPRPPADDLVVVGDPPFAGTDRRMVNLAVRGDSQQVASAASGETAPAVARQLSEEYLQAFYQLVADPNVEVAVKGEVEGEVEVETS